MRKRFAVIPTHDRPEEFETCYAAIRPQVDHLVVICHGEEAWNYVGNRRAVRTAYKPEGRANISAMWNLGIECAEFLGFPYDIAILNDDAIPAPHWFSTIMGRMHSEEANGASERRGPGRDLIAGWAFMLNGDAGIRADERFSWWYGDDDIQRQAEPWCFVEGITTPNTHAMTTSRSPEARAQIALDRAAFEAKYPA